MIEDKELLELEGIIQENKKHTLLDKVFESKKIDVIIKKVQNIYNKIYQELFIKLDLKNDLKQGKLFTILVAIISLITLTIILFVLMNSLLGLNLIFTLFKYSLFSLNWLYKIIKNKGILIKKYLSNLFPQSELLKNKEENKFQTNSNFTNLIFNEINNLVKRINKMNLDLEEEKELVVKLKEIVLMLQNEDGTFEQEIKFLDTKQEIAKRLSEVECFLNNKELEDKNQDEFLVHKETIIEDLDNLIENDTKSFQKRLKNI